MRVALALYKMVQNKLPRGFVTKKDEWQFHLVKRLKFIPTRWFRQVTREILNFREFAVRENDGWDDFVV